MVYQVKVRGDTLDQKRVAVSNGQTSNLSSPTVLVSASSDLIDPNYDPNAFKIRKAPKNPTTANEKRDFPLIAPLFAVKTPVDSEK